MDLFFDRNGEPLDTLAWAERRRDLDYCTLAYDEIETKATGKLGLSTVWMGIDMGLHFGEPHVPVIFETMLFGLPDGELPCWRYTTEQQAVTEHERLLALLSAEIGPSTA